MRFHPRITDQIAHFAVALGLLSLFAQLGALGGALAGLGIGLVRELSEAGGSRIALAEIPPHFAKRDPWIDLAFWTLGGLTAAAAKPI
ncbi:hypothetical protein [Erythrobacter sp. WG]|uniref:hypothetical protein n=1 Tax=Erythrobacter sp. WG TaxID=2985510 RepID=UPI00226E8F0F|nr:hypothetical protein [Erythrobacter sp. WG]MCX9146630.1 hypothetical protein [Erythrobacter sp. WG]